MLPSGFPTVQGPMLLLQPTSRFQQQHHQQSATNAPSSSNPSGHTMATPNAEIVNALSHPEGPEFQLSVGEGTYTLSDSLYIAMPPPHHQDTSGANANPLATAPVPPRAGMKLSIGIINPRRSPAQILRPATAGSMSSAPDAYSLKEHENEPRSSHETASDHSNGLKQQNSLFGQENPLLSPSVSKEGLKRKKPKTNLVKSNSQFISRVIPHDQIQRRLQDHNPEGLYMFANLDRAYQWLDLSSPEMSRAQPLIKILFAKANILCHDINHFTKSIGHIDVVMGANTGDIVWFEAYSQKYARINKGNIISSAPITEIRWLPGSENLFLASHVDGTLIVYDKEREDAAFIPETSNGGPAPETTSDASNGETSSAQNPLHINKSVTSKNQKCNPVASWQISHHRITSFAFSPSPLPYLAVVSEDGSLRVINYMRETLTDLYPSYYGGFTCVCWSPDGKYVLTGGQDDLVTLWSLHERRIVARCQGHRSWVTAVAFDPWRSCDGRNYRFGSVGEDRRLLLWDFNIGMLRRPKAKSTMPGGLIDHRGSVTSYLAGRTSQATNRLRSNSSLAIDGVELDGDEGCLEHEVESRTVTAELPPVMSKVVDEHRMSWLGFEEDCIITACAEGHVRLWRRPSEIPNPPRPG